MGGVWVALLARRFISRCDMNEESSNKDIIDQARETWCLDDEVQIDDKALISHAKDGVWVQAWVWVPYDE